MGSDTSRAREKGKCGNAAFTWEVPAEENPPRVRNGWILGSERSFQPNPGIHGAGISKVLLLRRFLFSLCFLLLPRRENPSPAVTGGKMTN